MPNEARHRHDEYGEAGLAARAAWLYFSGGMTQGQIAKRLGVTSIKAHRLIARANRDGLVRVFVDAEVAECLELEETIRQRFGLEFCSVAPDLGEETALPLRVLGIAGANFLNNEIERGEHALIGVGHGRTLAAAVEAATQDAAADDADLRVVLLSPACASFDQFRNFEERGDQFRREVQRALAVTGGAAA